MALTTSLHTALTGLSSSSRMLNVTGNNIANVNTTGFKRSRINFQTSLTSTLQNAAAPTANSGGRNPAQLGHGTRIASIMRDFSGGPVEPTGVNTDLAIEGGGFFVVRDGETERYTRSGNFDLDSNFDLVTSEGAKVMGFGIDENNQIVEGDLEPINIPLGNQTVAEATENVQLGGNLNAGGDAATQGSINTSSAMFDGASGPAAGAGTLLDDLHDAANNDLFDVGDVITLQTVAKGGSELPTKTFEVGAANTTDSDDNGTTLQDFMDFLEESLGIDTSVSGGVNVNGAGELEVTGNSGTINDLAIDSSDIIVNKGQPGASQPFTWSKTQEADGESVRTTFAAYDSLGNEMTVDVAMVLEDKTNAGTSWRYYVQSDDGADLSRALGTGTIDFDTNGELLTNTNPTFLVDRTGTGAETPQTIELDLDNQEGTLSALSDEASNLVTLNQDGSSIGTLEDFTVGQDGTVNGIFSNSLVRTLGRVGLANFANPEGLEEVGSNLYGVTTNSGAAQIGTPIQGGRGRIVGSALEQSNVDLSAEFTDMIAATTGFSANSRVLTTSERLIQELLNTIR
ncbi:MAG: flagellar hook protein FlgE [Phycisphaeraceae bacterium]